MRKAFFVAVGAMVCLTALSLGGLFGGFSQRSWTALTWDCADNVELFDKYVCFGADLLASLTPDQDEHDTKGVAVYTLGPLNPLSSEVSAVFQLQRNTQRRILAADVDVEALVVVNTTWHDTYPLISVPPDGEEFVYKGKSISEVTSTQVSIHCPAWSTLCNPTTALVAHSLRLPFVTIQLQLQDIHIKHESGYKLFQDASLTFSIGNNGAGIALIIASVATVVACCCLLCILLVRKDATGIVRGERAWPTVALVLSSVMGLLGFGPFIPRTHAVEVCLGIGVCVLTVLCCAFWILCELNLATISAFRARLNQPQQQTITGTVSMLSLTLASAAPVPWSMLIIPHVFLAACCLVPAFAVRPLLSLGVPISLLALLAITAVQAGRVMERGLQRQSISAETLYAQRRVEPSLVPNEKLDEGDSSQLSDEEVAAPRPIKHSPSMLALLNKTAANEDARPLPSIGPTPRGCFRPLQLQLASALTARLPYSLLWISASIVLIVLGITGPKVSHESHTQLFTMIFAGSFLPFTEIFILCDEALKARGARKMPCHRSRGMSCDMTTADFADAEKALERTTIGPVV